MSTSPNSPNAALAGNTADADRNAADAEARSFSLAQRVLAVVRKYKELIALVPTAVSAVYVAFSYFVTQDTFNKVMTNTLCQSFRDTARLSSQIIRNHTEFYSWISAGPLFELEQKLRAGTITPFELQYYNDLKRKIEELNHQLRESEGENKKFEKAIREDNCPAIVKPRT